MAKKLTTLSQADVDQIASAAEEMAFQVSESARKAERSILSDVKTMEAVRQLNHLAENCLALNRMLLAIEGMWVDVNVLCVCLIDEKD